MKLQHSYNLWKNKKFQLLFALLAVALLTVIFLYFFQNRKMNMIVDTLTEDKQLLTREYKELLVNFDSLQTNHDTINIMLEQERQRVQNLIEELQTVQATNLARIREYERELATLRGVLRSFVIQIDSLNARNLELTRENLEHRRRVAHMETSVQQLEIARASLQEKVNIASRLEATGIRASGLNPSGRATDRSNRATQIQVCFVIEKNVTAPVGMKTIYLRLERPDGQLLMHSRDDLFTHEGSQINFSAARTIEYGGENTEVCIFYNVDVGELISGDYVADIFANEFHIGSHKFTLK